MPQRSNGSPPWMATANDKHVPEGRWQTQGQKLLEPTVMLVFGQLGLDYLMNSD